MQIIKFLLIHSFSNRATKKKEIKSCKTHKMQFVSLIAIKKHFEDKNSKKS